MWTQNALGPREGQRAKRAGAVGGDLLERVGLLFPMVT